MLEVIALDADDARAAQAGGADRLELVADMDADGLTPALETFAAVRAAVDLPVRVMLRAADGFSAGGPEGVAALCAQAKALRTEGADEFVLGFLDEAGQPDVDAVSAAVAAIDGRPWTFHRAIDRAADRDGLRKRLTEIPGPDAFLTAGSAAGVDDGWDVLVAEAARTAAGEPGYGPLLMVGGGLRLEHVPGLREAGLTAFHIGGAARPGGWSAPVETAAVARWRTLLDD
jgi:copper homeostasis protein